MESAQHFVIDARRQLIRIIALVLTVGGLVMIGILGLLVFALPSGASLIMYPLMLGLVVAGSAATLLLLPRWSLGHALLPMVAALAGGVLFSAAALRETTLSAVAFLPIVVLLISLGQSRSATLIVGALATIMGVVLAATAPQPTLVGPELSLGPVLPLATMASAGTIIVVIGLISGRILAISDAAIRLADQRASEADAARARAEEQALELVRQNEAQDRLLGLVATLEVPAVALADSVVLVPVIGHVDTRRAEGLTSRLLATVRDQRVRYVILDVSGIAALDTGVIQGLLRAVQAVRLLGAEVIMCGVRADVAATVVHLGVDFSAVLTVRTPQEALTVVVGRG